MSQRFSNTKHWLYSQAFLGAVLVWHYVKKVWPWRRRHGLLQFRQNYVAEGAPRYFESLRAIAHEPGQCTACGLCEAVCPIRHEGFIGPMRLVLNGMQGGNALLAKESSFRVMASDECTACGKCEAACPEGIQMRQLSHAYLLQIEEIKQM